MFTYSCTLEKKLPWMVILDIRKHKLWETIMNHFPYLKMESDWATHHYCNYMYTYISVTILLTLYKRLLNHWTHQWFKYNSKTISFSSDCASFQKYSKLPDYIHFVNTLDLYCKSCTSIWKLLLAKWLIQETINQIIMNVTNKIIVFPVMSNKLFQAFKRPI